MAHFARTEWRLLGFVALDGVMAGQDDAVHRYRFRTEWHIAADADRVYAALADVPGYPSWWPEVRATRESECCSLSWRCLKHND